MSSWTFFSVFNKIMTHKLFLNSFQDIQRDVLYICIYIYILLPAVTCSWRKENLVSKVVTTWHLGPWLLFYIILHHHATSLFSPFVFHAPNNNEPSSVHMMDWRLNVAKPLSKTKDGSSNLVPKGQINNISVLVQIMAPTRRQASILANDGKFTDAYMRHSPSTS